MYTQTASEFPDKIMYQTYYILDQNVPKRVPPNDHLVRINTYFCHKFLGLAIYFLKASFELIFINFSE